jgi:hypothetical protein
MAIPNLSDKRCISSGIDLASSAFLYGKSDTAFKLPTRPLEAAECITARPDPPMLSFLVSEVAF